MTVCIYIKHEHEVQCQEKAMETLRIRSIQYALKWLAEKERNLIENWLKSVGNETSVNYEEVKKQSYHKNNSSDDEDKKGKEEKSVDPFEAAGLVPLCDFINQSTTSGRWSTAEIQSIHDFWKKIGFGQDTKAADYELEKEWLDFFAEAINCNSNIELSDE